MQPPSLLSKIQVLTGLAAHRGYISFSGGYTEDVLRKMPLKELYECTIREVLEMIKVATPANAREYRKLIKAVAVNFKAWRVRYISRTTFLGRNFTPKGMETERLYNRMLRVLEAALQILQRIHTARAMAMQQDNLEEALDGLIGEDWDRNAVLMKKIEYNGNEMDPFDQKMIEWTTKRSRDWLGISLFTPSNISKEAVWEIMPRLDFYHFSLLELNKIHTKYMRPEGLERTKHWASLSHALCKLGLVMIEKGGVEEGRRLLIEGLLMKVTNDHEVVENTVDDLLHREFPDNMLKPTQNFSRLILAFRAGLLFEDTMPDGLDFQHVLLQPLQSAIIQPIDDQLPLDPRTYLKAAIFVLRHLKLKLIHEDRIAIVLYESFVALGGGAREFLSREAELGHERLQPLLAIYGWYLELRYADTVQLGLMYPDVAQFCERVLNNEEELNPSKLLTSFNIAKNENGLDPQDQVGLIHSVYLETSLLVLPNVEEAFLKLMLLSPKGLEFLKALSPYVHGLRVLAEEHLNADCSLALTAPTDLRMVFGKPIRSQNLDHPSFDEFLLMTADQKHLHESFHGHKWAQWLFPHPYKNTAKMVCLSSVYFYLFNEEWLVAHGLSQTREVVNLMDISLREESVLGEFNKPFGLKFIYADRITPGRKLLSMNCGEYRLRVPGGFMNVHRSLLRNVAVKNPQLEADEVNCFLEFCYTHRLGGLTFSLAARLLKKAHEQKWKGIGEYCLAYMMGSTSFANLPERWNSVQGHIAFAPFRYFCARFCMNGWAGLKFDGLSPDEQQLMRKIAITIFHERCVLPSPPDFVPVDLREALPANQELICADGKAFPINLLLMSLHSGYFEKLLHFGGKEALAMEPIVLKEFSSESIHNLLAFIHSGVLPFDVCEFPHFLELCLVAQYFQVPIMKKVLVAWLKSYQINEIGFDGSILKKLALFAMGYRPTVDKNDLITLFNAARSFKLLHLEKEFAGLLGISEESVNSFIQYTQEAMISDSLTQLQLDIFKLRLKYPS